MLMEIKGLYQAALKGQLTGDNKSKNIDSKTN